VPTRKSLGGEGEHSGRHYFHFFRIQCDVSVSLRRRGLERQRGLSLAASDFS